MRTNHETAVCYRAATLAGRELIGGFDYVHVQCPPIGRDNDDPAWGRKRIREEPTNTGHIYFRIEGSPSGFAMGKQNLVPLRVCETTL